MFSLIMKLRVSGNCSKFYNRRSIKKRLPFLAFYRYELLQFVRRYKLEQFKPPAGFSFCLDYFDVAFLSCSQ